MCFLLQPLLPRGQEVRGRGHFQGSTGCSRLSVLGFTSSKNSDFPFKGDAGEPEELFIQSWGPGAALSTVQGTEA